MSLVSLQDVQIGFRGPLLLDGVSCQIHEKQRIGLLGRNGAGKTTLMRMLCGQIEPDKGEIVVAPQAGISWLPQEVPRDLTGNVEEIVFISRVVFLSKCFVLGPYPSDRCQQMQKSFQIASI